MTDYRIYPGTVSAQFLLNNGVALSDLPTQSDMSNGRIWVKRPGNGAGIVTPAKFVDTITGGRYGHGGYYFEWILQALSPLMSKYIRDTYMSGGYFGTVTVSTFNRETGAWETYNAIWKWPNVRSDAEMAMGGLHNVKTTFVNANIANDGPDLSLTDGGTTTWLLGDTTDITFTTTNGGDDETFDVVYVVIDITANVYYDSHTATGWTAEYSVDNGSNYSSSAPGDLTTVTNVRFNRNDTLDATASYDVITVTFESTATGESTITAEVTTTGDTDTDNDDLTVDIIVQQLPVAVADSGYTVAASGTLTVNDGDPDDLLINDTLGYPVATLVSFGAGDIGGTVDDNTAGDTVALSDGDITVNANGSFVFNAPTTPGSYGFDYKLQNAAGSDTATVSITVT